MNMCMRSTTFNWFNSFNKSQMANISRQSSIVGRVGHSYIGSEYITSLNISVDNIDDGKTSMSDIGNVNVK